jgi:hypothetical protein
MIIGKMALSFLARKYNTERNYENRFIQTGRYAYAA